MLMEEHSDMQVFAQVLLLGFLVYVLGKVMLLMRLRNKTLLECYYNSRLPKTYKGLKDLSYFQ